MLNRILVPLDGSRLAERALEPAATLARYYGAELLLVRVPEMTRIFVAAEFGYGVLYPSQALEAAREEAADYLRSVQAGSAVAGVRARSEVAEGDVAGAIVDLAGREGADLIVMSSHGYSGLARWLLGSVAERVLRAAPCPVWVVRATQPMRHVVITLDGSPLAEEAIGPALEVAKCFGADVTLLRVVPRPTEEELRDMDEVERGLGERLVSKNLDEARRYLDEAINRYEGSGLNMAAEVRPGLPAAVILKYVDLKTIDLVAMATHGRTGLRRWIYGSITEKVLHSLPYSMLIARLPESRLA
jgi:nucleotide-binding universal stress UspA family protein